MKPIFYETRFIPNTSGELLYYNNNLLNFLIYTFVMLAYREKRRIRQMMNKPIQSHISWPFASELIQTERFSAMIKNAESSFQKNTTLNSINVSYFSTRHSN